MIRASHRRGLLALLALVLLLGAPATTQAQGGTFFPETGFGVSDARIWDYFQARGGVDTFGYPVSTVRPHDGFPIQIFQRHVLQIAGTQVRPLNLLDPDVMPIAQYGGLTFPAYEAALAKQAPPPSAPQYATAVQQHLEANVPNSWQGQPVAFRNYFFQAAPGASGGLRTLIALEVWGFPTSQPARDPNNSRFIYQRFQRGIMHFDATTGVTRGILLGDAFKERLGGGPSSPPPPPVPNSGGRVPIIGLEMMEPQLSLPPRAVDAHASWMRVNEIVWSRVERTPGERNWSALREADRILQALAEQQLTPMVIIRGTPSWAQAVAGHPCGPIRADALDEFAAFVGDMVRRYSQPPYNVHHWELGNEPDIAPGLVSADSPFGCWGDEGDPYYGGAAYAAMLASVYPAIKQADPTAQVILGGLLLDCDPTQPPPGKSCQPANFFEGLLRAGGGRHLDAVAYHAYGLWNPNVVDADREHPAWAHRGGAVVGKAAFLREVMARYGVQKPLFMNEGALLCHESSRSCPGSTFHEAQGHALPRMYARAWAIELQGAFWFTLDGPGWRAGGLLTSSGDAQPAYQALRHFGERLAGANFAATLASGAVEGYAFRRGSTTIQLYWANDRGSHAIPRPAGAVALYSHLGQPLPLGSSIPIGEAPVYIEIAP